MNSARSGMETLPDGRLRCWINHETLRGVTPKMLVWWFKSLEGVVEIDGVRYNRYRVWHPVDHLFAEYVKLNKDGTVGVGSVIHLAEMLNGRPEYLLQIRTEITKLDETGYIHQPRNRGVRLAEIEYEFELVEGGTMYRNILTFGIKGKLGRLLNPLLRRLFFDEEHGRAWIRHNFEEVGNFESFLPALYRSENPEEREVASTVRSKRLEVSALV